jgi:alkaline phosphatase
MKITLTLLISLLFITHSHCQQNIQHKPQQVKNIILMIGDGMGVAQIYAGYTVNKGYLNLMKSQTVGLSITYSADEYVTDSGAGGTAISTGKKTNNYSIGVNTKGLEQKTILESAEENGLATGLVVTSSITHATPASFIAHQISRNEGINIANDFIESGIDIFIGGGRSYFENPNKNIYFSDSLRKRGYDIVYSLDDIKASVSKNIGCLLAEDNLPPVLNGRGDYLINAVNIALEKLVKSDSGFFIMIEGSQIDWGGHSKNLPYLVSEMIDFDKAVGASFSFADSHPGTLVIVTADHETGGLSLVNGNLTMGEVDGRFSTRGHTGVMVPVFAYGEGAELFTGIYQNTDIYFKMMQLLGIQ